MLGTLIVLGVVLGVCICGVLEFKDRCQLFEFAIKHKREDLATDLVVDWLDFKARANLNKEPVMIKTLWTGLVKGLVPATQLSTLRLSGGELFKYPQETVDAWMSGYKTNYAHNVGALDTLGKDYYNYINNAWFRVANTYLKFPRDI